jgi:hypothetical protein
MSRGVRVRLLVIGALVVAIIAYVSIKSMIRDHQLAPFRDHAYGYATAPARDLSGCPYVRGKVVAVNGHSRRIDDVYFSLPDALRAVDPGEVGTIAITEWGERRVGHYTNGGDALRYTLDVTLVDPAVPAVVGRRSFLGGDPPETTKSSGDHYGSQPTSEVMSWLEQLPRAATRPAEQCAPR